MIDKVAAHLLAWNYRLWGFGEGIGVRALLETDVPEYRGFVRGLFSSWLGRGGPKGNEDHVAPGVELLELYERCGDPVLLDAAQRLALLHRGFTAAEGAHLHRTEQPGFRRQIWVDCMHVDGPFLARYGALTGEAEWYDDAAGQLLAYARLLQQPAGLFRHGWEQLCGPNGQLWARGNGWALTGMVDTLRWLPAAHDAVREIRQRLDLLMNALARTQTSNGLWHTVLDDPDTYEETTLAAMVAIACSGTEMANRAGAAVLANVTDDGVLARTSEATPVGEHRMYATRPFGVYPWGQGPLLLMLLAGEKEKDENRKSRMLGNSETAHR